MSSQPAGWYPDPHDSSRPRYWDGQAWAPPAPPPPSPTYSAPPPPSAYMVQPTGSTATGKWYFVITLATVGLFAAVPFFHAASRLGRPQLRKVGAGIAAASILGFTLVGTAPEDAAGSPTGFLSSVGAVIMCGVMVVATAMLVGLRREVYQSGGPPPAPSGNESARASVEEARRKRTEARKLAARDPLMARELGIGQPLSGHSYDDGGLLDLNLATEAQLRTVCGLSAETAAGVVLARENLDRFEHVEDAVNFGRVPEAQAVVLRERGIVINDR